MNKRTNDIWQIVKRIVIDFALTLFSLFDWRNDGFSCSEQDENKKLYRWLLLAAVLFGALLRIFIAVRDPQFTPDGVYYLKVAEMWSRSSFSALIEDDPVFYIPPVMLGLIQFCIRLGCPPPIAGSVLNLLFGIGLIPLFYFVGQALFDSRKAGVVAAFLVSFNPVLVNYSSNIMRENFMLAFEAAFLFFAILGFRKRNIFFAVSGFCLAWAIFSRYEALEILPFMALSFLWFAAAGIVAWKKTVIGGIYFLSGLVAGCVLLTLIFQIPFSFYTDAVWAKIAGTLL